MSITQNGSLKRDDNDSPVMGGTSSSDNATIINSSFDPVTRRLLTDIAGGGTSPGLPFNSVQYNDAGTFAGSTRFLFDPSTGGGLITVGEEALTFSIQGINASTINTKGASVVYASGNGNGAANGGDVIIASGDGGATSGTGGSLQLVAGAAQGTNSDGGSISVTSGSQTGAGNGGAIELNAFGNFQAISATTGGPFLQLGANKARLGFDSGGAQLHLGDSSSTTTGIYLNSNGVSTYAILDTSALASTDKTFAFPNTSGTLALTSDISAAALTIGSTVINSGTTTRILYDNAGVLGEYTLTGTGTVVVMATAPTMSNPIVGTQASTDNSTKAASTAYVTTGIANAIAGVNPAVAVSAATTASGNTSTWTYANGVSGIGATFTGPANTAIIIDGITFSSLTQSLLVKNDTQSPSGAFNGMYDLTALQTVGTGAIFTRRLDYDTPSDINNTGAIPVVGGTVNALTSWLLTSNVTTVGTSPLTYVQFTYSPLSVIPPNLGGTGVANNASSTLTISGSFGTTLTVSGTTAVTLPTSGTLYGTASASITSSQLATSLSDETGSGSAVFATTPTLVTPVLGVATATSINKMAITAPSSSSTLAVADGKTFTASNTMTLAAGADSQTWTFPSTSDTVVTLTATQALTNKRVEPRTVSATSYTTDTGTSLTVATTDEFVITAQAGALKFNNPGGSPINGEKLIIRIKDNGTARALTYDTQFRASSDLALPTTTVISKTLYMGFIFNSTDTTWDLLAVLNNF